MSVVHTSPRARAEKRPHARRGPAPTRLEWLPRFGFLEGVGSVFNVFGAPEIDARRYLARCDRDVLARDMTAIGLDMRHVTDTLVAEQPRLFDLDEL